MRENKRLSGKQWKKEKLGVGGRCRGKRKIAVQKAIGVRSPVGICHD